MQTPGTLIPSPGCPDVVLHLLRFSQLASFGKRLLQVRIQTLLISKNVEEVQYSRLDKVGQQFKLPGADTENVDVVIVNDGRFAALTLCALDGRLKQPLDSQGSWR